MNFQEVVMRCFDNLEYRKNWGRLRKRKLSQDKKAMRLFIKDVKELIWDRLPFCAYSDHNFSDEVSGNSGAVSLQEDVKNGVGGQGLEPCSPSLNIRKD